MGASRGGAPGVVVAPDAKNALTMPILSLNLEPDQIDHLMRHDAIEKFVPQNRFGPRRPEEEDAPGESTDGEGQGGEEDQFLDAGPGNRTGAGGRDGGYAREGGYGVDGGYGGEGGYGMDGGYGGEGGYGMDGGYGGEGGYGMDGGYGGEGGYGMDGGYGRGGERQSLDPADLPEFQMFRFIDLDVKPGKEYVYKIQLWMEDPNDPDQRSAPAPSPSTLDVTVKDRVFKKNQSNAAAIKKLQKDFPALRNYYFVKAPVSEPSSPVTVTYGRRIILGTAKASKVRKGAFPKPGDEPEATMLALEFDRYNATNIPAKFSARRGTVGNFEQETEVPYWGEGVLKKWIPEGEEDPKPYPFRTNMAVLDIDGGRELGLGKLTEVAEVLVWQNGKMSIMTELDTKEEFEKFDFPAEEDVRRGGRDGGYGADGGYGDDGGGRGRRGRGRGGEGGEGGYGDGGYGDGGYGGEGGDGGRRGGGRRGGRRGGRS